MPLEYIFWGVMIACVIFGFVSNNAQPGTWLGRNGWFGSSLIVFLLLGMLGWRVFGSAVK